MVPIIGEWLRMPSCHDVSSEDSLFVLSVVPMWTQAVTSVGRAAVAPEEFLTAIRQYQRTHAGYDLPSETKIKAELFYYKAKIFERLFPYYATVGLIMIFTIITLIIRGKGNSGLILKFSPGWLPPASSFTHWDWE